jgi:quinol monooxygenase YgiN
MTGGLMGLAVLALAGTGMPLFAAEGATKAGYGLIGQMKAQPGQRDALIAILHEGLDHMPGNLAFVVGADSADPDSIWITELWTSKQAHDDALKLPAVAAAIGKGRPLIAGMGVRAEFNPT